MYAAPTSKSQQGHSHLVALQVVIKHLQLVIYNEYMMFVCCVLDRLYELSIYVGNYCSYFQGLHTNELWSYKTFFLIYEMLIPW